MRMMNAIKTTKKWTIVALLFACLCGAQMARAQQSFTDFILNAPTASSIGAAGRIPVIQNSRTEAIVQPFTTINSVQCVLSSTCTVTAVASALVVGVTTITSGSDGYLLYNNAGVLGNTGTIPSGITPGLSTLAGHLPTNAALVATTTALYPNGVWRDGVSVLGDAPPSFWQGQSGTCASHSMVSDVGSCNDSVDGNSFISDNTLVDQFGAVGDNSTLSDAAITAAIAANALRGVPATLGGGTYRLSASVIISASNSGLIGPGILFLPKAYFDCQDSTTCRYDTNAVGINASGLVDSPYTQISNVTLSNFVMQYESDHALKRYTNGIVSRNVSNLTIDHVEMYGFPVGAGIKAATLAGNWHIEHNYIHDFYNNDDTWPSGTAAQITAIELDNDVINSVGSTAGHINFNTIQNMVFGAAAITAYNYQTDGINMVNGPNTSTTGEFGGKGTEITGNVIDTVGEGIDDLGWRHSIIGNTITNCYLHCVNFKHSASYNTLAGNTISRAGLGGVLLTASGSDVADTTANLIADNNISVIDPDGINGASTSKAPIRMTGTNPNYNPTKTMITGNALDPGTNGNYVFFDSSFALGTNQFTNNNPVAHGSSGPPDYLVQNSGTAVFPRPPGLPSISSGFGTSPSIAGAGSSAFAITVGSGGTDVNGVVTLPQAPTGWSCSAADVTTKSATVFVTKQAAGSRTTVTLASYDAAGAASAWVAADVLRVQCTPY